MKYLIQFHSRHKAALSVISRDEEIVWAEGSLSVFEGEPLSKLLNWLENKQVGTWAPVSADCRAPRVTRTVTTVHNTEQVANETATA